MARDAAEAWGAAAAPSSTERSGKVTLGWARGLEGKEGSEGEGPGESWEVESCRGEGKEKEDDGVSLVTLGQGVKRRGHPIGESWRILGHGIQTQGDCHQRQGGTMALQEG